MAENYSAVVTELGASLIEDAYNNSTIVNITQMAIGDSNGAYVEPNPAFSSLVNELGREDIHESSTVGHLIHVYVYVTSKFAGDTVREFGLYDDANNLVVYAAYPESLVPDAASGEYIQLEIECIVDLESAEVVNIVVNPIYPHATELEAGIAKIVSETDVDNDEEDSKFLTIKKLLKRAATTVKAGVARFSTSAEAINGTDTTTMLNPSAGLALLKSRISSAPDGTRTDYSASESALSQVNTKAVNAQETADKKYDKTGGRITGVVEQYKDGHGVILASVSSSQVAYIQAGNYDTSKDQKLTISGINGHALDDLNIVMEGTKRPTVNTRDMFIEMPFDSKTNPYDVRNATSFTYSSKGHAPFTGSFISFGYGGYQIKIGGGYREGAPLWFNTINSDLEGDPENEWRQIYDSLNPPPNTAPVRVIILSPEVITSMGSYTFPDGITWYDIVELGVTWTGTTGTTIQTSVFGTHIWNDVSLNSSTTDFAGYLPVASTGLNFGTVAKASGNGFTLSTTSASGKVQGMYAYITAEAAARLATRNMHIDKAGNIFDAKKIVQLAKNITTAKEHAELEAKEIRDWNDSIFMEIVHQRSLLDAIQEEPDSASKSRMIIKHEEEISLLESKYKAEPESNSLTK